MKNTHTPGPWQRFIAYEAIEKMPPYNVWTVIGNTSEDERKHSIVATTITDDDDARLIAAAPELLEACKTILLNLDPEGDHPRQQHVLYSDCLGPENDDETVVQYLRKLIAKAEGK